MSKERVIILSVVKQGLTKAETARKYGVSWRWVHTLVTRWIHEGDTAFEPRSRKPRNNPRATSAGMRDTICKLRTELTAQGLDAGPETIAWHLTQRGLHAPSISTIRRILTQSGLVTPEPKKRPRSSLHRFEADQPNECWQSDFTHWRLADGTDIEILNWLDDHSRYLLRCTAHKPVTGSAVINEFTTAINEYGPPATTLTDNGLVYTARFRGGRNGFEHLIAALGIQQKNGRPSHPQTQGKIERFHQTLKRWLASQPKAATLEQLQQQLDKFRHIYNHERPHRALNRRTPATVYNATIKATPSTTSDAHYRVRHDTVDQFGKLTLRHAGKLRHLGIGIEHARKHVLILVTATHATTVERATGQVLSSHTINSDKNYWRNETKNPGRWPGFSSI